MPIRYRVDRAVGCIFTTAEGTLTDEELLVHAQRDARALIESDADLSNPDHAKLRSLVEARYRDRIEMFGVG